MSSRGATWRGRHRQRKDQRLKSRAGQRNRRMSDRAQAGQVVDFPRERFEHMARVCRCKVAYREYADALDAKRRCEKQLGRDYHIYECPICGRWHLTTHEWIGGKK